MNDELLAAYLNDHLAGSVIAVEMGENLRSGQADDELKSFLDVLLAEIEQDRNVLKELIARIGGEQSSTKTSLAWLTEKIGRFKTGGGDSPAEIAFGQLEQFETLMLGIRGKLGLWELLEKLTAQDERLGSFDWGKLKETASRQMDQVDQRRVRAGREAFL